MLASNNILFPSNGDPSIVPSQDVVLGLYFATREKITGRNEGAFFADVAEARRAYDNKEVELQTRITVRIREFDVDRATGEKAERLDALRDTSAAPCCRILPPPAVLGAQPAAEEEGDLALINTASVAADLRETVIFATSCCSPARAGHARRPVDRHRRHADPAAEGGDHPSAEREGEGDRGAVHLGSSPRASVQTKVRRHLAPAGDQVGKVIDEQSGRPSKTQDRHGQGLAPGVGSSVDLHDGDSGAAVRWARSASSPACAA